MGLTAAQKKDRSVYLETALKITECSQRKPYVFVSYASDNWETVFKDVVVPLQRRYGLRVYADKAFDKVNDKWIVPMLRNVRGADMMVAFVSQSYIESYACFLELLTAVNNRKQVVFVSLEEDLHLGDTTDQPVIERGAKNEILNQGANISTNTNNTSSDIMRAMKSAFTSLSTLLEQDALAKYDISDAFINFFRDAAINRKSINDLGAVQDTIRSISRAVFDQSPAPAPVQEPAPVPAERAYVPAPAPAEPEEIPAQAEKRTAPTPAPVREPDPVPAERAYVPAPAPTEPEELPPQAEERTAPAPAPVQEPALVPAERAYVPAPAPAEPEEPPPQAEERTAPAPAPVREPDPVRSSASPGGPGKGRPDPRLLIGAAAAVVAVVVLAAVLIFGGGKKGPDSPAASPGPEDPAASSGQEVSGDPAASPGQKEPDAPAVSSGPEDPAASPGQNGPDAGPETVTNEFYSLGEEEESAVTLLGGELQSQPLGSYSGQWRDGKPQGTGTYVTTSPDTNMRFTYEGEWANGLTEGKGVLTVAVRQSVRDEDYTAALAIYEGEFTGRLCIQGTGRLTVGEAGTFEGEWADGMPVDATFTKPDGTVFQGGWSMSGESLVGSGTITYPDGGSYQGEWADSEASFDRSGTGRMTYADGGVYEGEWEDDERHGTGRMLYSNGTIYDGQWKGGEPVD